MPPGDTISETVARIQSQVNSVYTDRELEPFAKTRVRLISASGSPRKDGNVPDSDSEGSSDGGAADSPFAIRLRRPKDLGGVIAEGRGRLLRLERQLKTQERIEAIRGLADWFEHRAPEVGKEIEELNSLELRHSDSRVEDLTRSAGAAASAMETEVLHSVERVDQFFHHLMDEVGGPKVLEKFQERRNKLQQEFEKCFEEEREDEVLLQSATAELQKVQERYNQACDPRMNAGAAVEEQKINEVKQAVSAKMARVATLEQQVEDCGNRTTKLQKIMSALKMETEGGLASLHPSLKPLVATFEEKATRGLDASYQRDPSVTAAMAKAAEEVAWAEELEQQAKDLEEEAQSRLGRLRAEDDEASAAQSAGREEEDSSSEEVDEESTERAKAELLETLHNLRVQRNELLRLETNSHHVDAQMASLARAQQEVRRGFRAVLERLESEEAEGLLGTSCVRPDVQGPTAWHQHLEEAWKLAKRNPELYARVIWGGINPILAEEGEDIILGSAANPDTGIASSRPDGQSRGVEFLELVSDLRAGERDLWRRLRLLEEDVESQPASQDSDPNEWLSALRSKLDEEEQVQWAAMRGLAEETGRYASGIEFLLQKLLPEARRQAEMLRQPEEPKPPRRRAHFEDEDPNDIP